MNRVPQLLVSVIIPTRNEADCIEETLNAVFSQDYPLDCLEVIVADGMSTDGTRAILAEMRAKYSNLTIVDNPARIVPTGFNKALKVAKGDVIVRVDGHTIISPDYVRCCVSTLHKSRAQNVGGRMTPTGNSRVQRAIAAATTSPFGVGGGRFHYSEEEEWVDTVYMGAWPRKIFDFVGGFDEEQVRNQDDEFNYRILEAGGRIYLNPKISSVYSPRSSYSALWRQYFQYGYWKVRVMQKHPKQMRYSQFVPPLFVLCLCLCSLLGLVTPLGWGFFIGVLSPYLVAGLVASAISAGKELQLFPVVMTIYPVLHVSYGAGFLLGVVRFWNKWGEERPPVAHVPDWKHLQLAPSAYEVNSFQ